jgi:NAD+ kinase
MLTQSSLVVMANRAQILEAHRLSRAVPSRIGLVVHPTRAIDEPLRELHDWADRHSVALVQIPASCQQRHVAEQGVAEECDLLMSIGGDGTTLAAIGAGALSDRPVLPIACGSLGVLTSVPASGLAGALDRFSGGDWVPRSLPGLVVQGVIADEVLAFNDVALVRAGPGQIRVSAYVDGTLFARLAGDGWIVSTPVGSGAYTVAAGGPLLAADTRAFVLTPLTAQGGGCPPLVISAGSEVRLEVAPGHGHGRLEIDGRDDHQPARSLAITVREDLATVVSFADAEPFLTGLRRRHLIADSPRILGEDERRH